MAPSSFVPDINEANSQFKSNDNNFFLIKYLLQYIIIKIIKMYGQLEKKLN